MNATRPCPLTIVVLTLGRAGVEVAARLRELPEVGALHVVSTDLPGRDRPLSERIRLTWLRDGPPGLARAVGGRLVGPLRARTREPLPRYIAERCPGASHLHLPDLHAPGALGALRALAPDLGIVFGCYKLRRSVFEIPRLGMLNLHLGRAPEFRGSSPGFYEMLAGLPEVGITVHRLDEELDTGPILMQESFPLDPSPEGDPLDYLERLQREVLLPNGARMMATAVRQVARGEAAERRQEPGRGKTRPRATWALKQELRRVVARRRAVDSPIGAPIS